MPLYRHETSNSRHSESAGLLDGLVSSHAYGTEFLTSIFHKVTDLFNDMDLHRLGGLAHPCCAAAEADPLEICSPIALQFSTGIIWSQRALRRHIVCVTACPGLSISER